METVATHDGTVIAVSPNLVKVQMQVVSACASCEAHARCTFAEKKDKTVDINTAHWQQYAPGDPVTVVINSNRGLQAVLIAYVMPALLVLAVFALLCSLHLPEVWVALAALLAAGLYAVALYLMRNKLQRRFTFALKKK